MKYNTNNNYSVQENIIIKNNVQTTRILELRVMRGVVFNLVFAISNVGGAPRS